MNQITINRFDQDLRRLERRFRFATGHVVLEREGEAFLQVCPSPTPDLPGRHLITLSKNMRPMRAVQQLPCGVIRSDGQIVAAAWTNELGQAEFVLTEGSYGLRYVWNVEDPIDAEILVAIGDALAHEYLKACLEEDELPDLLRERVRETHDLIPPPAASIGSAQAPYRDLTDSEFAVWDIARVLDDFRQANPVDDVDEFQPVPASSLRWLDDAQRGKWRRAATMAAGTGYVLSGWSAEDGRQPVSDDWVQLQGDDIVVRPPAELVPYGVVRIFAKEDDLLVGTRLLPLPKYGPLRSNRCEAYRMVGDRDPRTVNWYAQPATLETLEWFPAAEVEELLQRGDVQERAELRNRVELLLELAREREAPEQES